MSPLTLYLAKLIGTLLIVTALWMMVRKDAVLALMERIIGDAAVIAYIGLLRVTLGLALVIGHDIWSGGVLAIIVTLIGWLTFLRGLLMLFLPHEKLVSLYEAMGLQRNYAAYAGVALLLGCYLLIAGYVG